MILVMFAVGVLVAVGMLSASGLLFAVSFVASIIAIGMAMKGKDNEQQE